MKEKERKSKVIEIIALIIAILVLLFCLWSYSKAREVSIKDKPDVAPGKEDLNIIFSPFADLDDIVDVGEGEEKIDKIVGVSNSGESVGEAKVIATEEGTIADLQAKFTKPGQEVVYTFYSHNRGKHEAYLDTITYSNVKGGDFFKNCRAVNPNTTNEYLVSSACKSINMTVNVGDNVIIEGSVTGIKDYKLGIDSSEKIVVTIKYDENGALVDGDFLVEFGALTFTYLSRSELGAR